jgi:small redox-active disulfide protein 2
MALFGKRKEKDETKAASPCCCGGGCESTEQTEATTTDGCCGGGCDCESMEQAEKAKAEGASVKVLGSGCAKCNALELATKAALEQLGMDTTIEHVTDFAMIASYGVMSTPALVVDGKVVSYGKALKTEEVVAILKKVR